jgi:hypothetical protein
VSSCSNNQPNGIGSNELHHNMPRVKLTGNGRMPVMDMRSNNILQNYENIPKPMNDHGPPSFCTKSQSNPVSEDSGKLVKNSSHNTSGLHPQLVGLPPKSPVYAVVNKANKRKIEKQSTSRLTCLSSTQPNKDEVDKYVFDTFPNGQ